MFCQSTGVLLFFDLPERIRTFHVQLIVFRIFYFHYHPGFRWVVYEQDITVSFPGFVVRAQNPVPAVSGNPEQDTIISQKYQS